MFDASCREPSSRLMAQRERTSQGVNRFDRGSNRGLYLFNHGPAVGALWLGLLTFRALPFALTSDALLFSFPGLHFSDVSKEAGANPPPIDFACLPGWMLQHLYDLSRHFTFAIRGSGQLNHSLRPPPLIRSHLVYARNR